MGTREIADELGGLSPGKLHAADLAADALHRALGAAARDAAVPLDDRRTLVAMSGGVDSAVAALLVSARDAAVAVTLELWRDEENDAAASCCSADAVRLARSVAHRMGLPHFTLDLRAEFRAGVVDPFLAGYAAGETPNPCVGCNGHVRLDAMLDLADRLGARDLATGHYARVTDDGLLRVAADPAKDQTYMLAALVAGVDRADALPARGADQAGGARAGARGRAAGRVARRLAGPVLPRRHGQGALPRPPRGPRGRAGGDRVRRAARSSARTAAPTTSPSASARASASPAPSRSTCCAPRRGQPRRRRLARRARRRPRPPCAAPACTGRAPRSTPSACATTRAPSPAASPGPRRGHAPDARARARRTLPRRRPGPVRVPACAAT